MTTDRGRQFESTLFSYLNRILGVRHCHTTAFHPCANGMVERLHQQLKTTLTTRLNSTTWVEAFPMILLRLRTVIRTYLQCSAAELVYGNFLGLPGDFFISTQLPAQLREFLPRLLDYVRNLRPTPPGLSDNKTIIVHAVWPEQHAFSCATTWSNFI